MATEVKLIVEMVTVLGAATAGGYLSSRLHQPVLLGYLLGGIVVGPAGFGLVTLEGDIEVLASVGVALLLFALGVELSLKDLLRMRRIALGGGLLQILLTIVLGGGLAYALGWVDAIPKAIFLGAVLSLSSTAVVLKSLIDRNEMNSLHGQIMLTILIVQDLAVGIMLAVLPALTQSPEQIGSALVTSLLKALLFMGGAALAGIWLIPKLVRLLARTGSSELFLLGILVLCLGVALLTSAIGLGIEMGAFVAGLLISNVEYSDHALDRVMPMRDVFATLFFASIGLLIDPEFLLENIWVLLGLVSIVMVGKAAIAAGLVRAFGYPLRTALTVGLGINQIGEFSFLLAGVARSANVFTDQAYGLTVGTAAATLLVTPFLMRSTPRLLNWLGRFPKARSWLDPQRPPKFVGEEEELTDHVVVAGYGRVGQTLVRMLYFQGYKLLVIDSDQGVLLGLRDRQIPYMLGDASSPVLLEKANLHKAKAMAIALPDPFATRLALQRALSLAPDLDITVRANASDEIDVLYQLGAQEVVQPEFEASLEMGAHLLLNLGDAVSEVQQVVHRYRSGRYRDIMPERAEYWGRANLETATEGFLKRWYVLSSDSPLVGQSLSQANVRRTTGATIMAIDRQKRLHAYPLGDTVLELGDRLLVIGSLEEHQAFAMLMHRSGSPSNPSRYTEDKI